MPAETSIRLPIHWGITIICREQILGKLWARLVIAIDRGGSTKGCTQVRKREAGYRLCLGWGKREGEVRLLHDLQVG